MHCSAKVHMDAKICHNCSLRLFIIVKSLTFLKKIPKIYRINAAITKSAVDIPTADRL